MISTVRGTILEVNPTHVVVEVGGVGLAVAVTPGHAHEMPVGSVALLRTALVVREDDLALYGFRDIHELGMFDLLRGVTGVGPKSALGVMGAMTPNQIAQAVEDEADAAFRRVSGIGPKTAKLIILSLTGKVQVQPAGDLPAIPRDTVSTAVISALIGLGWSEKVAAAAVAHEMDALSDRAGATTAVILRSALGRLGPQRSSEGNTR